MSKLRFRVVHFSSEDSGYPADELNVHSPNTRGWQSVKFSEYPQELGFELIGSSSFRLSQVQILSHQSKISKKIEIFIGTGASYHTANYKRLGYLSLDSNERSNFQARELKTVYIDHSGKFIRLIIHDNWVNKQNLFNQVGIVAVNLLGVDDSMSIGPSSDNHGVPGYAPRGAMGPGGGPGGYRDPSQYNPLNDLSIDMNLDPQTASKLRLLSEAKARAINTEDYATAKQIKIIEGELKTLGSRLAQLDVAKRQAVEMEDYDRARDLKEEADELRGVIEQKIMATHIPGISDGRQIKQAMSYIPPKQAKDDYDYGAGGEPGYSHDDRITGSGGGAHARAAGKAMGDVDDYDYNDNGDRPIRPKERSTYDDRDPDIGEMDEPPRFREEKFAPGQHPLEGVPNLSELPTPEDLMGKSRDVSEQGGITALIGEFRARCLFSKVWALREAAIMKTHMMLEHLCDESPGINNCLPALCTIVRVGVEDKIQQVLFNAVGLMEDLLAATRRAKITRSALAPLMDPIVVNLLEKLADGNARLREGARKGCDALAASPNIGPAVVGAHALRALPPKQKTAWRPIMARLQLLTDLVSSYGVGGSTGLSTEAIMNFVKNYGAFAHSNGEVRDAAKDLTVALQKIVGTPALESYLKALRPKQLEEYLAAFDGGGGGAGMVSMAAGPKKQGGGGGGAGGHKNTSPPSPRTKGSGHLSHSPGGKVNTSASRAADGSAHDASQDFTSCMFCGASDKGWNEDSLDLHYWKDCPLLAPCPACAQVVEIAGLPEHLLDECEHKANFAPCDVTGLAIRVTDMDRWKRSPACVPAPANCMYCPLCQASVEDSDEAWRQHLVHSCPKNSRTQHGS